MNSFGRVFRVSLFGESHGSSLGVLLDGVPPGLPLSSEMFQADIMRRRPGAPGTTPRLEADEILIESGCWQGRTSGAPLLLRFINSDTRTEDYSAFVDQPRPGHVDFTAGIKHFGYQDPRGGGHFSGRITLGLVAAGVVAKQILTGIEIDASLVAAGGSEQVEEVVSRALAAGDSVGGLVACRVENLPAGLGEPFFDSVESLMAHALFTIPGVRGVEFGDGFAAAKMLGSEHNDAICDGKGRTETNHCGGVNGGISNGNPLEFRVAFKPTASIAREQLSWNFGLGELAALRIKGRHDACFALRTPVIVEAVAAIVLADMLLLRQSVTTVITGIDEKPHQTKRKHRSDGATKL